MKVAIENLLHEGAIGLVLTGLMVLLFLGSMRATAAVFLSIPLSALAAFMAISAGGGTVNTMVLGGLALAFSRLIDNSVVVLENIFRHLEMGEAPEVAAEKGGQEVSLAVLAATLTTAIVFFPVIFLYGVSRFLFVALAMAVVLSLLASYVVAMTVVPLFCAKLIKKHQADEEVGEGSIGARFGRLPRNSMSTSSSMLGKYDRSLSTALLRPVANRSRTGGRFPALPVDVPAARRRVLSRAPTPASSSSTSRLRRERALNSAEQYVKQVEDIVRKVVPPNELGMIVSNIGITPDFSAIYTPNSAPAHGFRAGQPEGGPQDRQLRIHAARAAERLREDVPQLSTYFQSGGLVDSVLNMGMPAPIDVQVSGSSLRASYAMASRLHRRFVSLPEVSDVLVPQDIDYPALQLDIDREKASLVGLSQKEVVDNVITALTSNGMIAPNYWVDPKSGNPYMLTVQYPEDAVKTLEDLKQIPLRGAKSKEPTMLDTVVNVKTIPTPTEVDHYQLFRVIDVYVSPKTEDLGKVSGTDRQDRREHEAAGGRAREPARIGAEHAVVFQELRDRTDSRDRAGLPDSGGPVRFVPRSVHHPARRAAGTCGRASVPAGSPAPR